MGYIQRTKKGEFDFDNLPTGIYTFTGEEGLIKVTVDKTGTQKWDFENWFSSLDPDEQYDNREIMIEDIKKRLNPDTGIVKPKRKSYFKKYLHRLCRLLNIKS